MIKVLASGFYTTVQDKGRRTSKKLGVPISGAMDGYSAQLANALLNNDNEAAVVEITLIGPTFQFLKHTFICLTGADLQATLNRDKNLKNNQLYSIKEGDILSFGKLIYGVRAYLGIWGGITSPPVLDSRSMFKNITPTPKIEKDYLLPFPNYTSELNLPKASLKVNFSHFESSILETFEGPEFYLLSEKQKHLLFQKKWTVSNNNNRMAYVMEDEFENTLEPIITSVVLPGTVQLTPSGQLIILMRDAQTTGGYPRILQLSEMAINRLSQKKVKESICFKLS